MANRWFAVRTLFRWEATGRPSAVDADFDPDLTLVEDRLVLVKARDGAEAVRKGETEAKRYAAFGWRNPYGQRVRTRYLGACDAHEIDEDDLGPNVEIFADLHGVPKEATDRALVGRFLGSALSAREVRRRRKFADAELIELLDESEAPAR